MLWWAITYLVIAVIAAVVDTTRMFGAATDMAWVVFVITAVVAIVLALVAMICDRGSYHAEE